MGQRDRARLRRADGDQHRDLPPSRGEGVALHVFDGTLVGTSIAYGDGKRTRDVVQNWKATDSGIDWNVRVTEPTRFRVALDYALAATASESGFAITIGSQRLTGRAAPTGAETTFAMRDVGEVMLAPGEHRIVVRPTEVPVGGADALASHPVYAGVTAGMITSHSLGVFGMRKVLHFLVAVAASSLGAAPAAAQGGTGTIQE